MPNGPIYHYRMEGREHTLQVPISYTYVHQCVGFLPPSHTYHPPTITACTFMQTHTLIHNHKGLYNCGGQGAHPWTIRYSCAAKRTVCVQSLLPCRQTHIHIQSVAKHIRCLHKETGQVASGWSTCVRVCIFMYGVINKNLDVFGKR